MRYINLHLHYITLHCITVGEGDSDVAVCCLRRVRQRDADGRHGRQVVQREGEARHAGPQRTLRRLHRESEVPRGTEPTSGRRTGETQGQVGQGNDADQGDVPGGARRGQEVSG